MSDAEQDRYYLEVEADAFFERNRGGFDPARLRPHKRAIVDFLDAAGVRPRRVLEFGCCYGDLLAHYAARDTEAVGVEPSAAAIAFGREHFGGSVRLERGTIAENTVNADPRTTGTFDLVVVDDVLCWVARAKLFRSLANIDAALGEGGHLFLREFHPQRHVRNRNHHAGGREIYCYKPAGPHVAAFLASGMYAVVAQRVSIDEADTWAREPRFESRWIDSLLRKSFHEYYDAGRPPA